MNLKKLVLHLFCITLITSSISATEQKLADNPNPQEVWLTFFVHGIMSIKPHLSLSNFIRFMADKVENTVYSSTVELMRADPVFHQNQAMQDVGVKEIDPYLVIKGNASSAMALAFEEVSSLAHPGNQLKNHYYTCGWSGLLSPSQRYIDAVKLYKAIGQIADQFTSRGIKVNIRLVGYSHGGNVILNLALVRKNMPTLAHFTVNELILLGMPVQKETDYLINDPIFEKIIHMYSRDDHIQKLDFFSWKRFFSRRVIKKRRGFNLPNKLIQIQLKCTRNSVCTNAHQANLYNFNKPAIISGKSRLLRNASPGHTELWFFGWTPANYRKDFPLYPLPIAALIPLIIPQVEKFKETSQHKKPIIVDIRPEQEVMLIGQTSTKAVTVVEFLSKEQLRSISDLIMRYAPENYTRVLYSDHIKIAYNKAVDIHKARKKLFHLEKKKRRRCCKRRKEPFSLL